MRLRSAEVSPAAGSRRSARWPSIVSRLLFIIISAEVGGVLLVYPWLDTWGQNFLSGAGAGWYAVWMNSYFRGALSGLGVVNLYISFVELARFFRPLSDTMKESRPEKD